MRFNPVPTLFSMRHLTNDSSSPANLFVLRLITPLICIPTFLSALIRQKDLAWFLETNKFRRRRRITQWLFLLNSSNGSNFLLIYSRMINKTKKKPQIPLRSWPFQSSSAIGFQMTKLAEPLQHGTHD